MDEFAVSSIDQLTSVIDGIPGDALFRGQVNHHTTDDGAVSISTSFSRQGCIPALQFKWSYYAKLILRFLSGRKTLDFDLHLAQAVLQHYGWRSFFIDASADPAVAAWFACHAFTGSDIINGGEDCFEAFVMSYHQTARYDPVETTAFLYALSQHGLSEHGIECFDLTKIETKGCRTRFHAQRAWLVGPLRQELPPECIQACISGPATVFKEYAVKAGHTGTSSLFPPRAKDPFLGLLLSVPWVSGGNVTDLPLYSRGLPLPEYDYEVIKRHPSSTAFFQLSWIADDRGPADSPFSNAVFYRTPEQLFYGRPPDMPLSLPNVKTVLRDHGLLVIESQGILRHPEMYSHSEYLKGVCIQLHEEDLAEVCEVIVEHPGSQVTGAGLSKGWYYRIGPSDTWSRQSHPDECPCNNTLRHQHHMWVIAHFEALIAEGKYAARSKLDYAHSDLATQP